MRIYSNSKVIPMETITVTKIQKGTINEKFEKYVDCFFLKLKELCKELYLFITVCLLCNKQLMLKF